MRHSLLLGCSLCVGMRGVAGIERIAWCGGGVAAWLFASRCGADGRLTVACGESRATAAQPSLYQEHGWHLITIQKRVALRWWPSVVLTPIHEVSVHLSLCDSLLLIIRCFWYLSCIYSNIHIIPQHFISYHPHTALLLVLLVLLFYICFIVYNIYCIAICYTMNEQTHKPALTV